MTASVIILYGFFGITKVWTESSLTNVCPDHRPGPNARPEIRLYAARGEQESFQICIRTDKKPIEEATVRVESVDSQIGAPDVRLVGYLASEAASKRASGPEGPRADPLLDLHPVTVAPGATVAFWVTYSVPHDAKPGVRSTRVSVVSKQGRAYPVMVTLEVFDFELPALPSLRTRAVLDRDAIREFYNVSDASLDSWRAVYDAFTGSRLSLSVLQSGTRNGLLALGQEEAVDASYLKEHLEYLVPALHMNAVDVSDSQSGLGLFPAPPNPLDQDPLQIYLLDLGNWLEDQKWIDRAYVVPGGLPPRSAWPTARDEYFRVRRADQRIKRLMIGPAHPYFERYTDIWAMPLRCYHPLSWRRLREGMSLTAEPPYPALRVVASSAGAWDGAAGYDTVPQDAYDGCLFTAWRSSRPPTRREPQYLEIHFEEPVRTDNLTIGWVHGGEAREIRVRTSAEGAVFGDASVAWRHYRPLGPYDASWSEGRFKMMKVFRAVRIEFLDTDREETVGVTEVEFGLPPDPATIARIEPIEIWLAPTRDDFPSFAVDAHPIEARLAP